MPNVISNRTNAIQYYRSFMCKYNNGLLEYSMLLDAYMFCECIKDTYDTLRDKLPDRAITGLNHLYSNYKHFQLDQIMTYPGEEVYNLYKDTLNYLYPLIDLKPTDISFLSSELFIEVQKIIEKLKKDENIVEAYLYDTYTHSRFASIMIVYKDKYDTIVTPPNIHLMYITDIHKNVHVDDISKNIEEIGFKLLHPVVDVKFHPYYNNLARHLVQTLYYNFDIDRITGLYPYGNCLDKSNFKYDVFNVILVVNDANMVKPLQDKFSSMRHYSISIFEESNLHNQHVFEDIIKTYVTPSNNLLKDFVNIVDIYNKIW